MSGNPVPSPIPKPYGGTPFTITTGTEVVPTTNETVLLSVNGNFAGPLDLAPGVFIGQTQLVGFTSSSSGSVQWGGVPANAAQTSSSPLVQRADTYAQETSAWLWNGTYWQLTGIFNPWTGAVGPQPSIEITEFLRTRSLTLHPSVTITDPAGGGPLEIVGGGSLRTSRLFVKLTAAAATNSATPAITDIGGSLVPEGFVVILTNHDASGFGYTLDSEVVTAGTGLYLRTPTVTLRPRDSITLVRVGAASNEWHEVFRAIAGQFALRIANTGATVPATHALVELQDAGPGPYTMSSPNISNGFFDGQTIEIRSDPAQAAVYTFEDVTVNATSQLKLSSGSFAMGPGSTLQARWDANAAKWFEIGRTAII